MSESEPDILFGACCFCSQQIEPSDVDPCTVTVSTSQERWQVWYCHARCFRERLYPLESGFFDPAHF